jgi:signal transduction histidine kinase
VGALAAGVAHHLSNPLTTVIAEAQLLKLHPATDELVESAEAIERAGWQAQAAVRRLIEFSEPRMVDSGPVELAANLRAALDLVGAQVESLGVTVQLDVPPTLPPVEGNARQLQDLWTNLLLLARAAIDDDQRQVIIVRAATAATGEVVVQVTDHGRPVPAELLPTLFDSAQAAQACSRGTGLELSICREIMRQHGGRIELASSPASGTTVTLTFPPRPPHDVSTD